MKVTVNEYHIEKGRRGKADECPVAMAINNRAECFGASVAIGVIVFLRNKKRWRATVPLDVRHWIGRFDRNEHVQPFSFNLHPTLINEEYV